MVEDNDAFAEVVCAEFLSADDVTVVGSVAAARGRGPGFDAALVDYDLPDGKGDAVVRALLAAHPTLPVVAISSHVRGNEALRAAGARATCAKPDFARIREVLRGL